MPEQLRFVTPLLPIESTDEARQGDVCAACSHTRGWHMQGMPSGRTDCAHPEGRDYCSCAAFTPSGVAIGYDGAAEGSS